MCPAYYEMIRVPDQSFHLRLRLAQAAAQQGIRAAAQSFGCSRNTVRKWLRRFQQEGKPGLQERSRRPHRSPRQTSAAVERRVLAARRRIPCFGPRRLKRDFDLTCSTGAIGRILRQNGLVRSRKKPPRAKRCLTAEKMQWPAVSRLQIDTKDLSDLPRYPPLIRQGLPRFQYTARLVPEGAVWLAFSETNDSTCALAFADRLLDCFQRHGVDLSRLTVQTDNGSEFGGTWNRKTPPPFTQLVEQKWKCHRHRFNPPHRSTYNSDVESVHGIMEPEFYHLESFSPSRTAFLNRAFSYQLFFNLVRRNSAKNDLTPEQLCSQRAPHVDPKFFYLPPVLLSSARDHPTPQQLLVGHHLPGLLT